MTMTPNRDLIMQAILDFMTVVYECHANTGFAEDRAVFAQDLMSAMEWVIRLRDNSELENVVGKILGLETEKHFGDYWRQGVWGDKEAAALKKLKKSVC
jgi:hypothetical protein